VWKHIHTLSSKKDAANAKLALKYIVPLTEKIILPVIVNSRDPRGKWYRHVHIQDLKLAPGGKDHQQATNKSIENSELPNEKSRQDQQQAGINGSRKKASTANNLRSHG